MLEVYELDKNLIRKESKLVVQGIEHFLNLKLSLVFERLSRYFNIEKLLL